MTSELTRLERTSAVQAAHRTSRVADPVELLEVMDVDCGDAGPSALPRAGIGWVGDRVRVARVEWFFTCLLVLVTATLLGFPGYAGYRLSTGLR